MAACWRSHDCVNVWCLQEQDGGIELPEVPEKEMSKREALKAEVHMTVAAVEVMVREMLAAERWSVRC